MVSSPSPAPVVGLDARMRRTDRLNRRHEYVVTRSPGKPEPASGLSGSGCSLDLTGLAWYLANGVIHNNRTLFNEVKVLQRASEHLFTEEGVASTPFWHFRPGQDLLQGSDEALSAQLEERLIAAVDRALGPAGTNEVFLSQSGGYDSAGIAAIAARRLGRRDIRCFSYVLGQPRPGTDAFVASQIAESLDLDHFVVQSFRGDWMRHLRQNVQIGQGHTDICDESDAWVELSERYGHHPHRVMLAGDECLGWNDVQLSDLDDVLASVSICVDLGRAVLSQYFPAQTISDLQSRLAEDARTVRDKVVGLADLHDAKDFLYLDERLPNRLLPWRDRFCGTFAEVRNPLLDDDLIDFIQRVPSRLRRGKRLYRVTMERMFPDLFPLPLGTRGDYRVNVAAEMHGVASLLRREVEDTASPLDAVLPQEGVLRMIEDATRWWPYRLAPRRRLRRLSKAVAFGRSARVALPAKPRRPRTPLPDVLQRILVLRGALSSLSGDPQG